MCKQKDKLWQWKQTYTIRITVWGISVEKLGHEKILSAHFPGGPNLGKKMTLNGDQSLSGLCIHLALEGDNLFTLKTSAMYTCEYSNHLPSPVFI